uniref:Uncharacterized protein n=1 Tax=Chromera velia CCMP2878 TaxID=1169474 RepID=A0A0G4HDN1_9ALVE|eukprot:Cvel_6407.t1-p1 / transcript=Cvel_6407.t1 / gene=Cvel_6407 / organism=Chromera_velia_CCMP2878 / gene_product=hypothetical protein / transcript_product=hypothetical protein / location=Cvel_scaffold313:41520-45575(+) / protein_length=699 / sequence_SO=supercontig / SO=protein_coding / is_pseudo=false
MGNCCNIQAGSCLGSRHGVCDSAEMGAWERKLELKETQMKKLKDEVDDLKKKIVTLEKGGARSDGASADGIKRLEEEKDQLEQELKEARLSLEEAKAAGGGRGGGDGSSRSTIIQKKLEMKEGQVKKQMDMLEAKNAEIVELKKQIEEGKASGSADAGGGEEIEKLRQELDEKSNEIEILKSKLAKGSGVGGDGGSLSSSGASGDFSVLQKKLEMEEGQLKKHMDMLKAQNEEIARLKRELEEAKGGGAGGGASGVDEVEKLKKEIQEKGKEIEELKAKTTSGGDTLLQKEEVERGGGVSSGGGESAADAAKWKAEAGKLEGEVKELKEQLEAAKSASDGGGDAPTEKENKTLKQEIEKKNRQTECLWSLLGRIRKENRALKRESDLINQSVEQLLNWFRIYLRRQKLLEGNRTLLGEQEVRDANQHSNAEHASVFRRRPCSQGQLPPPSATEPRKYLRDFERETVTPGGEGFSLADVERHFNDLVDEVNSMAKQRDDAITLLNEQNVWIKYMMEERQKADDGGEAETLSLQERAQDVSQPLQTKTTEEPHTQTPQRSVPTGAMLTLSQPASVTVESSALTDRGGKETIEKERERDIEREQRLNQVHVAVAAVQNPDDPSSPLYNLLACVRQWAESRSGPPVSSAESSFPLVIAPTAPELSRLTQNKDVFTCQQRERDVRVPDAEKLLELERLVGRSER